MQPGTFLFSKHIQNIKILIYRLNWKYIIGKFIITRYYKCKCNITKLYQCAWQSLNWCPIAHFEYVWSILYTMMKNWCTLTSSRFSNLAQNCANNDGSMQKFIGTRNIYRNRFKFKRCVVSSKVRIFSITLGYILA